MDDTTLTYADVDRRVEEMVEEAKAFKPSFVAVVLRGGIYPGAMVARALGVAIEAVGVKSYNGRDQGKREVYLLPERREGRVVVVDDIIDTGDTMRYVCGLWPESLGIAVMKRSGAWVRFPWE